MYSAFPHQLRLGGVPQRVVRLGPFELLEGIYVLPRIIDMFVQRFAKALAVLISLIITAYFQDFESIRYLSLITLAIIVVWFWAAIYAGNRFRENLPHGDLPTLHPRGEKP